MRAASLALLFAGSLALSACGSSTGDRAASGAGIGAATGAVIGAVTGLSIVEGVIIGAAAGGILGAVTDEETINLGDPVWESNAAPANTAAVRRVQSGLVRLGYDPGPVDGAIGQQTRSAIQDYQRDNDLLVDGRVSEQLAEHMDEQLQVAGY